jgi:hypothetical protein
VETIQPVPEEITIVNPEPKRDLAKQVAQIQLSKLDQRKQEQRKLFNVDLSQDSGAEMVADLK